MSKIDRPNVINWLLQYPLFPIHNTTLDVFLCPRVNDEMIFLVTLWIVTVSYISLSYCHLCARDCSLQNSLLDIYSFVFNNIIDLIMLAETIGNLRLAERKIAFKTIRFLKTALS